MLDVRLFKKDADYKHQLCTGSADGAQCVNGEEYSLCIRTVELNKGINYLTSIRVKTFNDRDNMHSLLYFYNDYGMPYMVKERLRLFQPIPTDTTLHKDEFNAYSIIRKFEDWWDNDSKRSELG